MDQNHFLLMRKTAPTVSAAAARPAVAAARVQLTQDALMDVVRKTGVVFFEWDLARGLTYISDSARTVLGLSSEAVAADPAIGDRLLQPAFRKQLTPIWAAIGRDKKAFDRVEILLESAAGAPICLEARVLPQFTDDGRVRALLGLGLDATPLAQARAEVHDGARRYRLIFEAAPIPMLLVDPRTLRVSDVNDRACRLLGGDEEELVGTLLIEHLVHDERDRIESYFKSGAGEAGVRIVPRTFFKRSGGTRFPAQIAAVNIHIDGEPRKLAVIRDLSDTESAEETLKAMRRAAEATEEAVVILDSAKRIVFANDASEALLGRSIDELHGQDPAFIVEGAWQDEWTRAVTMTDAGWLWRGVILFQRPGAESSELDVELVPVASPLGLVTHIVAVMRAPSAGPVDDAARWRKSSSSTLMMALLSHYVENALSSSRNRLGIMATSGELSKEMRTEMLQSTFQIDCAIEFTRFMREFHSGALPVPGHPGEEAAGDLVAIMKEVVRTVQLLNPVDEEVLPGAAPLATAPVRDPSMVREVLLNVLCNAAQGAAAHGGRAKVAIESAVFDGKQAFWVRIATPAAPPNIQRGADPLEVGLALCRELVEGVGGVLTIDEKDDGAGGGQTHYGVLLPAA